ncbi:Lrp/AsnC family transcriptional regulator [Thermoproteota archaeon]
MAEIINGAIKALVLLRIDPKIEMNVVKELKTFSGVQEAHMIYGPYDVYAIIECPDYDALNDLVLHKIRRLYGIKSTTTCYLAE